ncbi:glycoside hydrolase family 13 protein [Flavitalea sp.]|nr:glycoside hydrolase family 13 protein [Flavitalea sp.]
MSVIFINPVNAQDTIKVYPTHWWVGMKSKKLQLLIHAPGISLGTPKVTISYPGLSVVSFKKFTNTDYLALDLNIASTARAGNCKINIGNTVAGSRYTVNYQLKTKNPGDGRTRIQGVSSSDFMYLIMPDRFSNGDPSNDRIPGYKDQTLNRNEIFHRHGGDLKGVQNHLDYLQGLGVTAIWLNPVLENDMPERSEHGYAFTDHYQVDKRLGGNAAYHELVNAIHTKGMKIIQDAVYNHVGKEHHLFHSLPDSSWFHWWPDYTNTTYKDQVLMDPYASEADRKRMSDGWFVPSMPDLNQKNPFVANFLIQHAIWSTEEFGLDGWRIDTYAYNDLDFMNRCNKALLDEFPKLHMFGETWVHGVVNQAYFTRNKFDIPFKSNLPGVTDFQLNLYGILPATTQAFGWTEGVNRLYQTMANDFVYANPLNNVIFLDNHDVSRFYSVVSEDFNKLKMGIAWLLTFRGIPQLYYGTEILMKNFANPDGLVRLDFPGGWPGDQQNKFIPEGRSPQENEMYNYTRSIANFRKSSSALKTGKTMQYVPEDGVYVYFRYDADQTVMCIMNTNDREMPLNGNRFLERTANFTNGKDVITGNLLDIKNTMVLPAKSLQVLVLN